MDGIKQNRFTKNILKMIYYKKLELDHTLVAKKSLAYISANKHKITNFWTNVNFNEFINHVPELLTFFKEVNLTPRRVAITAAITDIGIHRDDTSVPVRINIPVLNCQGSQTKFWSTSVEPKLMFLTNGVPYRYLDETDCELMATLELDSPTVLRVKEPHSVYVGEKVPRISLTLEFEEDIEYLLND
jgi:hypothetical protein